MYYIFFVYYNRFLSKNYYYILHITMVDYKMYTTLDLDDVEKYEKAVDDVFHKLAITPIDELLNTPIAHTGLHRLTKE